MPTAAFCRKHGLSAATFHRRQASYGGMDLSATTSGRIHRWATRPLSRRAGRLSNVMAPRPARLPRPKPTTIKPKDSRHERGTTGGRSMRVVDGSTAEPTGLSGSSKPFMPDLRKTDSIIAPGSARFFSLRPMVRLDRREVGRLTLGAFLFGRDRTGMKIGYPAQGIPAPKILEDATRAWEAAR